MPRQTSNTSSNHRNSRNFSNTTPTIYDRKISSSQTPSSIHSHQTVEAPGIFSSIKQGIGLGMGSEIGHRVIGSFFGPSQQQVRVYQAPPTLPLEHQIIYAQCIEKNEGFPEICKPFLTKDKSVWKQCMEKNNFNHLECVE